MHHQTNLLYGVKKRCLVLLFCVPVNGSFGPISPLTLHPTRMVPGMVQCQEERCCACEMMRELDDQRKFSWVLFFSFWLFHEDGLIFWRSSIYRYHYVRSTLSKSCSLCYDGVGTFPIWSLKTLYSYYGFRERQFFWKFALRVVLFLRGPQLVSWFQSRSFFGWKKKKKILVKM